MSVINRRRTTVVQLIYSHVVFNFQRYFEKRTQRTLNRKCWHAESCSILTPRHENTSDRRMKQCRVWFLKHLPKVVSSSRFHMRLEKEPRTISPLYIDMDAIHICAWNTLFNENISKLIGTLFDVIMAFCYFVIDILWIRASFADFW